MDEAQKPTAELAKIAMETLRQLTEVSMQWQLFDREGNSLMALLNKTAKAGDEAAGLEEERGQYARTLKARINFSKGKLNSL